MFKTHTSRFHNWSVHFVIIVFLCHCPCLSACTNRKSSVFVCCFVFASNCKRKRYSWPINRFLGLRFNDYINAKNNILLDNYRMCNNCCTVPFYFTLMTSGSEYFSTLKKHTFSFPNTLFDSCLFSLFSCLRVFFIWLLE